MKVFPNRVRITLYYLIAILILGVVVYIALFDWFNSSWGVGQIVVASSYLIMGITLYIVTIKATYYVLNSNYLSFYIWGKERRYFYNDIIYINQDKGNSTPTIEMYNNNMKVIYLTTDSRTILYDNLLKKCKSLISKQDFVNKKNKY